MISTLTAVVTGTAGLTLSHANGYDISLERFGPGPRTWRRETITSPFMSGRWLIDSQLDTSNAPMDVFVFGTTASQFATRTDALLDAFSQRTYNLQLTIDGVLYEWACEPADIAPGADGEFNIGDLAAFGQDFHLSIPRDPVPVNGVL